MDPPPTKFLDRDGSDLAYQTYGSGPINLVLHLEAVNHLDLSWTDPHIHRNLARFGKRARCVVFNRRGFGLSDPLTYVPTLEQQADDVLAVMDACGMDRAVLFGTFTTCGAVAMVAACEPERVAALILWNPSAEGFPRGARAVAGWTEKEAAAFAADLDAALAQWGSGGVVRLLNRSLDTPYNRRLYAMLERNSARPAAMRAHFETYGGLDVSDVLAAVPVPTYVIRGATDTLPEAAARHVTGLVPGATFAALPDAGPGASVGEATVPACDFLDTVLQRLEPSLAVADRSLASVLFTDLVGSTELLARLGDADYQELRDVHERLVRRDVEAAGGRLVKVMGDGTMSVFDGAGRAVRCAASIRREARGLGVQVRAGVHTGEIEWAGPDVGGMTVHIAARVAALADGGQVLVSRTTRDILFGSGLTFSDCGEHELRGVPGSWQLYALASVAEQGAEIELAPSMQTVADRAAIVMARRAPRVMRGAARLGNAMQRRKSRRESIPDR